MSPQGDGAGSGWPALGTVLLVVAVIAGLAILALCILGAILMNSLGSNK